MSLKKRRNYKPFIIIAIITFVVSFLAFSNIYEMFGEKPAQQNIPISGFKVKEGNVQIVGEEVIVSKGGGTIECTGLDFPTNNIKLKTGTFGLNYQFGVKGKVKIQDGTCSPKFVHASNFVMAPAGANNSATVPFKSNDNVSAVQIEFENVETAPVYILKEVSCNVPVSFHFNILHFVFLFLICSFVYIIAKKKLYLIEYNRNKKSHRKAVLCAMLLCVATAIFFAFLGIVSMSFVVSYPLDPMHESHQYFRQFEAWQHGQIALTTPPSQELLDMANPYNFHGRENIKALFDIAFYGGKYYSYFGIAPLLVIYVPIYLVSGYLPSDALVCGILSIVTIVFLFGAVMELLRKFKIKANLLLLTLGLIAVTFGSGLFLNQAAAIVYYIAVLSTLAFLCMFIFLSFRAARTVTLWKRWTLFFLAAIAFGLVVMSRPVVALLAIMFVLPLFIEVLRNKERILKTRITDAAVFLIPTILIGCFVMWYNAVRFGSPLEFGAIYQLTCNDIRYNKMIVNPGRIWECIYQYFIQPLSFNSTFPFMEKVMSPAPDYGNYFFMNWNFGFFAIPISIFLLFVRRVIGKQDKLKKWTYILVIAGSVLLSFINFSLGGVLFRYTMDIIIPLMIISLLVFLELFNKAKVRPGGTIYIVGCAICILSIIIGFFLPFTNSEPATRLLSFTADWHIWIKSFFSFG